MGTLAQGIWEVERVGEAPEEQPQEESPVTAAPSDDQQTAEQPAVDSGAPTEAPAGTVEPGQSPTATEPSAETSAPSEEKQAVEVTAEEQERLDAGMTAFQGYTDAEIDEIFGIGDDAEVQERIEITQEELHAIAENNAKLELQTMLENRTTQLTPAHLVQIDEAVADAAEEDTGLWFKTKYWLNKNVVDPLIDKGLDKIPVVKYFASNIKSEKDDVLFQGEEKTQKTMEDMEIDKESAEGYNRFCAFEDNEKKLAPVKSFVEGTLSKVTKPFSWMLDKMGSACKSMFASSAGKEQKYIEGELAKRLKSGMTEEQINGEIQVIKDNYDEEESYKTSYNFLRWNSKGSYTNDTERFNLIVSEYRKNNNI